jgi:predicted nucleotidyltransferase
VPKATLTFNLPEERYEHEVAINGHKWKSIVYELSILLRNKLKHGNDYKTPDEALEDIKTTLWNECRDADLDPWGD